MTRSFFQQQQTRRRHTGDIVLILLVLVLAGMWIYYIGARGITGFSVLELGGATGTTLVFENQSLPLGALLEITIGGKKQQKDVSLLLPLPYEIEYDNATVYGWNEPIAVDIVSFVPGLAPGAYTVDATLSAGGVLLAMKTTTVTVAAPEIPSISEIKEEPLPPPLSSEPPPAEPELIEEIPTLSKSELSQSEPSQSEPSQSEPPLLPSSGPVFSTFVAGEGTDNWDANFTSQDAKNEDAFGTARDSSNNVFAVGAGHNITGTCTSGFGQCDDMWVKRLSSAGVENTAQWNKTFQNGVALGAVVDSTDNLYVAGYYRGALGNNDWWIKKFRGSTENTSAWNKTFEGAGSGDDRANGIAVDSLDNVYVVGYQTGLGGATDWWIKKFREGGTENTTAWDKTFTTGGNANDQAVAVAVDSADSVYIVGFGNGVQGGNSGDDWWIKKFLENGTENTSAWNKTFTGPGNAEDRPRAVDTSSINEVFVVGYGTHVKGASTGKDWWLKAFTETGTENTTAWNKTFTSAGNNADEAAGIVIDSNNNTYITGYGNALVGSTGADWWIKKFSMAGVENTASWNLTKDGGTSTDQPYGIVVDGFFNVTVVGSLTSGSTRDWWIRQYIGNSSGNTPPTLNAMVLNTSSAAAKNLTDENLTLYYSVTDAEGDQVKNTTTWKLNGTPLIVLNMPFDTNLTGSGGTKTIDLSGFGNNGSVYNATWNATGGFDGKGAYMFNGNNTYINTSDQSFLDITGSMSIAAWVYITLFSGERTILTKGGENLAINFNFELSGDEIQFEWYNNGWDTHITSGVDLALNRWYHIVAVHDTTNNLAKIYVDGSQKLSEATTKAKLANNYALSIGVDPYDGNSFIRYFNGTIDEVMIFNRSLTPAQVLLLYENKTGIISYNETSKGDVWQACVTPNDGVADGTTTCSNTLTVNNTAPAVATTSPSNLSHITTTSPSMVFTYTDIDSDTGNCDVVVNGTLMGNNAAVASGSSTTIAVNTTLIDGGKYTWLVNCTDGEKYNASGVFNMTVDTSLPNITTTYPLSNNGSIEADNILNLDITFRDTNLFKTLINITAPNGSSMFENLSSDIIVVEESHAEAVSMATWTDGRFILDASVTDDVTGSPKQPNYQINKVDDNETLFYDEVSGVNISRTFFVEDDTGTKVKFKQGEGKPAKDGEVNLSTTNAFDEKHYKTSFDVKLSKNADGYKFGMRFHSNNNLNFSYRTPVSGIPGHLVIGDKFFHAKDLADAGYNVTTTQNGSDYVVTFYKTIYGASELTFDPLTGGLNNVSTTLSFILDRTSPAIRFVTPDNSSGSNFSDRILNFTWNATDNMFSTFMCNLTIGNGTGGYKIINVNTTNASMTNFSFSAGQFNNGTNNWSVNCTDQAGNANTSGARFFTIDMQVPSISLVHPLNNSAYNFTTAVLNFTWNATDDYDTSLSCNLTIGNGSDYKVINVDATNGSLTNFSLFSGNFTEAQHNWTVNCTDNAGNTNASGRFNFTFDQTKPAVTTLAPRTASTKASGTLIEVAANVSDSLVSVSVVLANLTWPNGTQENKTLTLQSGNNYNNSYAVPNVTGTLNFTITANDSAGNVNITEGVNITLTDQTNPVLANASPSNGSNQSKDTTIQLSINVTDNINVSNVSVNITYPNGSVVQKSTDNPSTAFYNTSLLLQSEGVHNVTFAANDTTDNRGSSITRFNATEACRTVTVSTTMTGPITASGAGSCIVIDGTSNIVFDCLGYSIIGDGSSNSVGIKVANTTNVNITNCNITNFDKAVLFANANNSKISNLVATNSTSDDIVVNSSTTPVLTNSTAGPMELQGVTNFLVNDTQGSVTFLQSITGSLSNVSRIIKIQDNHLFVNVSALAALNVSANLTLTNLSGFVGNPIQIEVDYNNSGKFEACDSSVCKLILFNETTATAYFNVTHFSSYQIGRQSLNDPTSGGDRGARTVRSTTGAPGGGGGGGGGGSGSPVVSAVPVSTTQPAQAAPFITSSFLEGLVRPEVRREVTAAVSEGVLEQFTDNLAPAAVVEIPPVQDASAAWLIPLLLPLLLAITSLSIPTPRRVFCDEETLSKLIQSKMLSRYKKLYVTETMKRKADPDNKYSNLIGVPFSNKERFLINYLCERSNAPREMVELFFAAQKKKRASVITRASMPVILQPRFRRVRLVQPETLLAQTLTSAGAHPSRPLFIRLIPQLIESIESMTHRIGSHPSQIDEKLLSYVVTARSTGAAADEIAARLANSGWKEGLVHEALAQGDARLATLYQYVERAKAKGLPDTDIHQRLVKKGWDAAAAKAVLTSVESAFSELLSYVRRARDSGAGGPVSTEELVRRLAAEGWDQQVVSEELQRFNRALSTLANYVNNARLRGVSEEQLVQRLVNCGWDRQVVDEQLAIVHVRVEQLAQYLQRARVAGMDDSVIMRRLQRLGWNKKEVSHELRQLADNERGLLAYLRHAKAQGVSDAEIRARLATEGWDAALLESDLRLVGTSLQELIEYVKTAQESGLNDNDFITRLVAEGWERADVEHELALFKDTMRVLAGYVREAHGLGVAAGEITSRLVKAGWKKNEVAAALLAAGLEQPPAVQSSAGGAEAG